MKTAIVTNKIGDPYECILDFDTNVFECLPNFNNAEEKYHFITAICNSYVNATKGSFLSSPVYITRIVHNTETPSEYLLYITTPAGCDSMTLNIKSDYDQKLNIAITDVDDGPEILPNHFSPLIKETHKNNYNETQLAKIKEKTLLTLKKPERSPSNPISAPAIPVLLNKENFEQNKVAFEQRIDLLFDKENPRKSLVQHVRNYTAQEDAKSHSLALVLEEAKKRVSEINNLMRVTDFATHLNATNKQQLEEFAQLQTLELKEICENELNHIQEKMKLELEAASVNAEKSHHLLADLVVKHDYGNDLEKINYIKKSLTYTIYQAALKYLAIIWPELNYKTANSKKEEFNIKFYGVATLDDFLQISPLSKTANLINLDLADLQETINRLLDRCNTSLIKSSHATSTVVEMLNKLQLEIRNDLGFLPFDIQGFQGKTGFYFSPAAYESEKKATALIDEANAQFNKMVIENKPANVPSLNPHFDNAFENVKSRINKYSSLLSAEQRLVGIKTRAFPAIERFESPKLLRQPLIPTKVAEKPNFFKRHWKAMVGIGVGVLCAGAIVAASLLTAGVFDLIAGGIAIGLAALGVEVTNTMVVVGASIVIGGTALAAGGIGLGVTEGVIKLSQVIKNKFTHEKNPPAITQDTEVMEEVKTSVPIIENKNIAKIAAETPATIVPLIASSSTISTSRNALIQPPKESKTEIVSENETLKLKQG